MRRGPRLILAGVGITTAVALTLVGGFGLAAWYALKPAPAWLPPLADGLPRAFREGDHAFSNRIISRFPVGSPQVDLVRTLEAQGFLRRDADGRPSASFVQQSFPCRLIWTVDWSADDDGRIVHIAAHYYGVCL